MCIIEAIDIASTAINIATTVSEAKSALEEKKVEERQINTLIQQAKTAEQNAAVERQEGLEKARQQRLNAILNMSEQKANIAASNLSTNSATSLNILDDEKLNGELDALNTLKDAQRRSDSYMQTAQKYYDSASLKSFNLKMKAHKKDTLLFKKNSLKTFSAIKQDLMGV